MKITLDNLLPPGRPPIELNSLLSKRKLTEPSRNDCYCASLISPQTVSYDALVAGLRKLLPFIYRTTEEAVNLFVRYGMNVLEKQPIPDDFSIQWSHTGEILTCAFFEECEETVILSYKWRLNTSRRQNALGMDLLAFDLDARPPVIYAVAVKTSSEGGDGKIPTAVYNAINELVAYLRDEKLDDDLEIIAANLHTDEKHCNAFLSWYNPYTQGVPGSKPILTAVPAIVIDESNWDDRYARRAINHDFGVPGTVRILCITGLEELVRRVYDRGTK